MRVLISAIPIILLSHTISSSYASQRFHIHQMSSDRVPPSEMSNSPWAVDGIYRNSISRSLFA